MCVCVFFPSILDIKFVGRTSRGHTGGRSTGFLIHLPSAVRAVDCHHKVKRVDASHLVAKGASEMQIQAGRWKSLAVMVYVRAGGYGAELASKVLSRCN